jgi:hypothetical protein
MFPYLLGGMGTTDALCASYLRTRPRAVSPKPKYNFTWYNPFPDGHYIHPFHDESWDYSPDEGREHPRTVRLPVVFLRL